MKYLDNETNINIKLIYASCILYVSWRWILQNTCKNFASKEFLRKKYVWYFTSPQNTLDSEAFWFQVFRLRILNLYYYIFEFLKNIPFTLFPKYKHNIY